jgi:ubiquinone/menaquinone biosynthesis C-methylase UbiE
VLYGIDPSIDMVEQTKTNLSVRNVVNETHISQGIAEDLDFEDSFFNTLLMLDVYEHIRLTERINTLKEIKRVLKPGGELIITTPSRHMIRFWNVFNNLLLIFRRFSNREKIRIWAFDPREYTEEFCTKHDLLRDIKEVGFELKSFERVGFYPAPENPGFFGKWLYKTNGIRGIHRVGKTIFKILASLAVLNQKMLIRCCK